MSFSLDLSLTNSLNIDLTDKPLPPVTIKAAKKAKKFTFTAWHKLCSSTPEKIPMPQHRLKVLAYKQEKREELRLLAQARLYRPATRLRLPNQTCVIL